MGHPSLVRLLAPLILLVAGCGRAPGDIVATYKATNGTLIIEADEGGWGRIEQTYPGAPPLNNYTLITPQGRSLSVWLHQGRWIVADWQDRNAWNRQESGPPPSTSEPKGHFVEDGEEKVGEWRGTAYRMARGSCNSWSRFVVMRGTGLDTFGRVMRASYGPKNRGAPPCELQAVDLFGEGVLLWIDFPETILDKLEYREIDSGRFRLPSPLLSRSELFALMEAAKPRRTSALAPSPTMVEP